MSGGDSRTDEELIGNVKNGDQDSFRTLYDRYKSKIYGYVLHLIENKECAEDCTHDIFIHLYKMASHYSPTAKFSSWLYKMAKNMALDTLRKQKIRRAVSLDDPVSSSDESLPLGELLAGCDLDPEKAAESAEIVKLVQAGIGKLNETDRQLILLCDMEKISHKEAGEILGYPTQTITVKLYRARQRLAKILEIEDLF